MIMEMNYTVWSMNKFCDLKNELVAKFVELELAKDFVDYQMTIGGTFAIYCNNKKIYPMDEF